MTLAPSVGIGAEPPDQPPDRPVLLHNLTAAEASGGGRMGGAIGMLEKRFALRALPETWNGDDLKSARVVWLVSPGRPPKVDSADSGGNAFPAAVLRHVEGGGVLWIMLGDPAGSAVDWTRSLLMPLGIVQGDRRTGAKALRMPGTNPLLGGLLWNTGGITLMDTEESPELSNPVIVPNDLGQPPKSPRAPDFAGIAMIWGDRGRGRIAVLGDMEWLGKAAWEDSGDPGQIARANERILDRWIEWSLRPAAEEP